MDREAWWATDSIRLQRVRHNPSDLAYTRDRKDKKCNTCEQPGDDDNQNA